MINYIIQIAKDIVSPKNDSKEPSLFQLIKVLSEELDRLDPRDFLPDGQYEFVKIRIFVRSWAARTTCSSNEIPYLCQLGGKVIAVLSKYGGPNSRAESRSFSFISDAELRTIIERDYRELSLILLPAGAWKSTVILAGSILEAILYDILSRDPDIRKRAEASPFAPKDDSGIVKSMEKGKWYLHDLIIVSSDLNLLPKNRIDTIDQVLRDYRNFVHPKKEIRSEHPCTEAEAFLAKGALDGVCNYLDKY